MLKNISQLEVTINDKLVRLMADMDTDTNVVRAACQQFLKFIDQIEQAAQKNVEAQPEEVECLPLQFDLIL